MTARLDGAGLAALVRPRIAGLVLVSTACGFLLERPSDLAPLPWALVGTLLVAAAGCALNHFLERDTDARMERTRKRPLVTGALTPMQVLVAGVASAVVGLAVLAWGAGTLAATIEAGALVIYLGVYTPLKRRTSSNTWIGAVPGALPLLAGAAAAGGPTRLPLITFVLVFLWQLPHFFAIASMYRDQYASGGLRMLSGEDPDDALLRWQMPIQVMSVMLVSILPVLVGPAREIYAITALVVGAVFLAAAFAFRKLPDRGRARRVVVASVVYLPLVLAALVVDVACVHHPDHGADADELPSCCPPATEAAVADADVPNTAAALADADEGESPGHGDDAATTRLSLNDLLQGSEEIPTVDDGTDLPYHGDLPDFDLVADDGSAFTKADLTGRVWVVDFIFTRCAGPCPSMSQSFMNLAKADVPAGFLSVTVDPRNDGPDVLTAYRNQYGGDAGTWRLLTGSPEAIQSLAEEGFRMPVNTGEEPVAGMPPMFHSGKFALVDTAGRVRGYYDFRDRLELHRLKMDIAALAAVGS